MTAVQYVEYILDNDWERSRPARDNDVPKPEIYREKKVSQKRVRNHDVVQVVDGGNQDFTPAGLGWTTEDVTTRVDVVVRTTNSRERFEGHRDANNNADSWGGLYGEIKHILHERRKGDKEFDLVKAATWQDNSGNFGKNYWRGRWNITFEQFSVPINLSEP